MTTTARGRTPAAGTGTGTRTGTRTGTGAGTGTRIRGVTATVAAVAALAATAACGAAPDTAGDGDRLRVVAAFYPLEFVADRVGGDRLSVSGLTSPGADAHQAELTPSQVAEIDTADLVIYMSGFQPPVEAAVDRYARAWLDAATVVPPLSATQGGSPAGHHRDGGGDPHGHGTADPHVWLDPDRLAAIARAVADRLAAIDPGYADGYAARTDALLADLAALDAEFADGLAHCQRREIVVGHAAFGYLADRYGLRQIAIAGLAPEDEPNPHQVVTVVEEARDHGATTVFSEVSAGPEVAELIAGQLGATTATLDPIESRAPDSGRDYLDAMRANLAALREGLGCR